MDTQNSAVAEVPNFKLAKVGKNRERKRSGAGWLSGGRGAGSAFNGALGGSGAGAAGAGMLSSKMLVVLLISAISSAGAWQYGRTLRADSTGAPAAKKLFDSKDASQKYGDLSGVIKDDRAIPNSLGYVSGSADGLTPEERAKKAAEDEAARKAQEEADKKAQADADKAAAAPEPKSALDPTMLAKLDGSDKDKKGLKPGKFGQLSSAFGGSGLSGGAGLSGGINRNFGGAPDLGAKRAQPGAVTAFHSPSKPGMSRAAGGHNAGNPHAKGFAHRQLLNAFTQSRQATSVGKSETAAESAAAPFDNNPTDGNVIQGPGVAHNSTGAPDTPSSVGGPMGSGGGSAPTCGSGQYVGSDGQCHNTPTNGGKKSARYQSLVDTAQMLLLLAAVLSAIGYFFAHSVYGTWVAKLIEWGVLLIGAALIGIGVAIATMHLGDKMIGSIIGACGLGMAAFAAISIWGKPPAGADGGEKLIESFGAHTLIVEAIGYLGSSMMSAKSASLQ